MIKITVEFVGNGYIVRTKDTGLNLFKDPYVKPTKVFISLDSLFDYISTLDEGARDES